MRIFYYLFWLLFIVPVVYAGPATPGPWKDSNGAVTTSRDVGINTAQPLYPLDVRGDIFLPQQAIEIDCDGTATTDKGTCAAIADGAVLVPLTTSNVDLDGNGVADTNWLCVNSMNSPTILTQSNSESCPGAALTLLGTPDGSESIQPFFGWSFVDSNADTLFNDGEDLYYGAAPINRYSPTNSVIHGAVVVDGAVIIGGTGGAGGLLNNIALYTADGTMRSPAKIVQGQTALSGGTATVTLSGAAVFTGAPTYSVTASRSHTSMYAHFLKILNNSGSSFTFLSDTGSDTDTIAWLAVGY